jgi:tetratricopeptide (TPR) repeat protein
MTTRKTVGWLVFVALVAVLIFQVPRIGAQVCYIAGTKFYAAGKYHAAAAAFNGAVLLDRRSARGYLELGSAYLALGRPKDAERAFLKAKSIEDESCASCGLGMTYNCLGRHDAAEKEFNRAISLNPGDVCAYDQSGRMYYELGKYQEAIAKFKHALKLRPSFGTYMYLGNAHVYARQYEPGVDAYKKGIQLKPKDVQARIQLAIAYDYLRRYEEAAAEYKEAIRLDPKAEGVRYSLALVYMSLHNKPAALEQYEILRKTNPDMAAQLYEETRFADPRERGKEKLYFVPLGNFSAASLTKLANFCKQKTGITATVTQAVPFALSTIDKRRQQVIAEDAIELIKFRYPNLAADPNAVVIGVTDEDMYTRSEDWQYAFSYRKGGRFGVVSSARMNPINFGGSANDVLTESRLRKMVLKNIGILFYLYPSNHDPKSVLYDGVEAVADLDNMGEDF